MSKPKESEWENISRGSPIEDLYYPLQHEPCGTTVLVAVAHIVVGAKCQAEKTEEQRKVAL